MVSGNYKEDVGYLNGQLAVGKSFDVVSREIELGGKSATIYFIDGFCKDDIMQKLLEYFMDFDPGKVPENAKEMMKRAIPYVEVGSEKQW